MEPALNDVAARFAEVELVKINVDELPDVDRVVGAQENDLEKKIDKHKALQAAI
ncbi:hypothetical protein REPUB_Repub04eG0181200 [Reevesia pubescens]